MHSTYLLYFYLFLYYYCVGLCKSAFYVNVMLRHVYCMFAMQAFLAVMCVCVCVCVCTSFCFRSDAVSRLYDVE